MEGSKERVDRTVGEDQRTQPRSNASWKGSKITGRTETTNRARLRDNTMDLRLQD